MAVDPSSKENLEYKLLRHDLYNPINQIVGYSELLTEELEAGESIDPDDLAKIGTSARVLLEMIRSRLTESELQSERHHAKHDSSGSVIQLKQNHRVVSMMSGSLSINYEKVAFLLSMMILIIVIYWFKLSPEMVILCRLLNLER